MLEGTLGRIPGGKQDRGGRDPERLCASGPGSGDVTGVPLMSAVLLLLGVPFLPLLHPGPSPAYSGCSLVPVE